MTAQLSREDVKELRNSFQCWQQDYDPKEDAEQYEMFGRAITATNMLLAGMDSEPVAVIDKEGNPMTRAECNDYRVFAICCKVGTPLYAAPPAPVAVPDEKWVNPDIGYADENGFAEGWNESRQHAINNGKVPPVVKGISAYCRGWNAFRAAMLNTGPVTAATVPDGWTSNCDADAALVMLDRIDTIDCADDERIESVKNIIRRLAAAPGQEV